MPSYGQHRTLTLTHLTRHCQAITKLPLPPPQLCHQRPLAPASFISTPPQRGRLCEETLDGQRTQRGSLEHCKPTEGLTGQSNRTSPNLGTNVSHELLNTARLG